MTDRRSCSSAPLWGAEVRDRVLRLLSEPADVRVELVHSAVDPDAPSIVISHDGSDTWRLDKGSEEMLDLPAGRYVRVEEQQGGW